MNLETLRGEINRVSLEIVDLLLERRYLAGLVLKEKRNHGLQDWDPEREQELLRKMTLALSPAEKIYIEEIFNAIFVGTRGRQPGE